MTIFDLILLLILVGFVWFGFWNGLIQTLGGLVSLVVAVFVASRWYDIIALKIAPLVGENVNLSRIIAFIAIFILARFVVFLIIKVINKVFDLISFIPFLKTINRLAGAILGLIEGGLVLGLILYFSSKFPLGDWWINSLNQSNIAGPLIGFGKILYPLIPDALKQIKSLISG